MKVYQGKLPKGIWFASIKLDGVQVVVKDGSGFSKAGKPLYHVPSTLKDGMYEMFVKDWNTSVSILRTQKPTFFSYRNTAAPGDVPEKDFYCLDPVDDRLQMGEVKSEAEVEEKFKLARALGYEGLVLYSNGNQLKVKPKATYDGTVSEVIKGKGRLNGKMGALVTEFGKVGTGFTDAERAEEWKVGDVVEIEGMGLNPTGKLRHPRFMRRRRDKE